MSKTYTFKQIIFALRKEYIENEKQLAELKKHINVSDKIEYFNIRMYGNPSKLNFFLERKKNILEKIQIMLNMYIYNKASFNITNGFEKKHYDRLKKVCSIDDQEKFNKKIEEITQSDFFNNIIVNNDIPFIEKDINGIYISQNGIRLINTIDVEYPKFKYYPPEDELVMKNEKEIITPDDILKLLSLSIDGKYLNDYHHSILDNYEEKEIDIDDNFNSNKAKLEIIEEPKKLILKPKKIKI